MGKIKNFLWRGILFFIVFLIALALLFIVDADLKRQKADGIA